MSAITPLDLQFDTSLLLGIIPNHILNREEFRKSGQMSITHSSNCQTEYESWFESVGSLYDYELKESTRFTKDYTTLNSYFTGTYMDTVVQQVKEQAAKDGVRVGRIRLMLLKPKTCYSYHVDDEDFRYHIPLITNQRNFFVVNDVVSRMPDVGRLYRFRTNEIHTAVNASFKDRMHILFDTYV